MSKKVSIIGAGASGILSAILCAKAGAKVEVYEQNSKIAKKILVSGNGRCNISNRHLSSSDFFSENPSFVDFSLQSFSFDKFEKFCNEIGLFLNVLDDGRAYPLSNEAKSVVKIFENYAKGLGVIFHTETHVTDIKKLIKESDAVIVATGSRAGEHLGGNSDGEEFAKEFGHTTVPPYPSLVQLHLNSQIAKKMSGVKLNTEVTLILNGVKDISVSGDVLFTNYGVSGFAILDISQAVSSALLGFAAVDISVNLLPAFNMQKLSQHISKIAQNMPTLTILDILVGIIPVKIANGLLEELNIQNTIKDKEIHTKLAKRIANLMLNWKFEVEETHGFRHAEVSGGGIDTKEIDEKTMMSKKQKNLYFVGEVLDVVGRRGGYNFAFAWSSAYLAAKNITH
ncbi:NAD(P)/FAD-dependent oxidoreductase [Sulfurimonas sp. SAG-AH-194-C21]|nr:NAD(P)/FAD-dependent oxidoreductase [Sulfurimonas sp. SAG-AH-194-C21]MDF1884003.1 NAD(P)/FAD-dependent oxidoreductase [Sulfurimonas sp. SAG-AH-194-C21]